MYIYTFSFILNITIGLVKSIPIMRQCINNKSRHKKRYCSSELEKRKQESLDV